MAAQIQHEHISSIDILRVVCVFAVIFIHTEASFSSIDDSFEFSLVHYLTRFAVPVFFLISGYLWGKSLERENFKEKFFSYLKKILILFASWTAIYRLVVYASGVVLKHNVLPLTEDPPDLILDKFFVGYNHLWFLPSLAFGLMILYGLISVKKSNYIIPVSIFFYAVALLGKDYSRIFFGLHHFHEYFNTRNGPFFSSLFLAIGWWLCEKRKKTTLAFAVVLAILGLLLSFFEILYLYYSGLRFKTNPEFLVGTIPFSVRIFLIALARPNWGRHPYVKMVGRNVVGIYVVHYLMVLIISRCLRHFSGLIWHTMFPFSVFFLSLLVVLFLNQFRFTGWLVTGQFSWKQNQTSENRM